MAVAGEQLRTNPLARVVYQQLQRNYIGPDPLAVGGCGWPDTLTLHVTESEPLLGWCMWGVADTPMLTVGVSTAPDRSWCAVAVATRRPDGLRQVGLADYRPGTAWVPHRVAELRSRWGGRSRGHPSRGLLVDVVEPSPTPRRRARTTHCPTRVHAFTLRHGNEPALSTAVRAARA